MNKEIEISPRQIANAITDLLNENEQLQQQNQQLKDKVGELTNSWNEQIKLTNQENLDCSKYAVENHHLKSILNEIREHIEECCLYPELNNCSNMTSDEVKELVKILDKVKE